MWADGYARREGIAEDDFLKLAEIFAEEQYRAAEAQLDPLNLVLDKFFRWKADGGFDRTMIELGWKEEEE